MKIGVIGIGKLGLPFALNLERAGHEVIGVDLSEEYVKRVNDKWVRSDEPHVEQMLLFSKNLIATTDISKVLDTDIVFVLVATPSLPDGKYDHSAINSALSTLRNAWYERYAKGMENSEIEEPQLKDIVIGCTTMPGYCDTLKDRSLGLVPSKIRVSYSPEFIAQGTIVRDQRKPDMVLIGEEDVYAGRIISDVLLSITDDPGAVNVHRMSRKEAEITKLALNCFLTTKIAYANAVGDVALASNVRPEVILSAIGSDSRIGKKYLGYGYGFGGPCFPRDNRAFGIYAMSVGMSPTIPEATDQANYEHLQAQIELLPQGANLNAEITFDTVTYKPESTLLVESQQLKFAQELAARGYKVVVNERPSVIEELKKDPLNDKFTYNAR